MARKAKPKYRLDIPQFNSTYIPPFKDFCEVLQLPFSTPQWINMLSSLTDSKLSVSPSTVAKLTSEGVGEASFKEIENFFSPLMKEVEITPWIIRRGTDKLT